MAEDAFAEFEQDQIAGLMWCDDSS